MCSGRMEKAHADSIKAFLGWLNFDWHRDKFVFVLNKSDLLSDTDKQHNLAGMLEKFGVNADQRVNWVNVDKTVDSVRMNMALGFPPDAKFSDVDTEYISLTKAVLYGTGSFLDAGNKRIAVNKSSCNIL